MKKGMFAVKQLSAEKRILVTDLDEALDIVGTGRYQVLHCLLMLLILTSALMEMVGSSFIIPAAACDLNLVPSLRGIIASVPNIGVILTSSVWGKASDSVGRRPTLLLSTAAAGVLGCLASLMPEVTTFAMCKFAASLFLSCPSSLSFAFGGEMMPKKRRDMAVMLLGALLMYGGILLPLLAWAVLSNQWVYRLGQMTILPWRLLTVVYAFPLLLCSLLLIFTLESPKYLVARGKYDKALMVLRSMYSMNTGLPPEEFPVSSLKVLESDVYNNNEEMNNKIGALALFRPPHLKWLALTGFLMFGVFSSLHGLFIFSPDTINKILSDVSTEKKDVCSLLQRNATDLEVTNSTICVDEISETTFQISAASTALYATMVLIISLSPLKKRTILVLTYFVTAVCCMAAVLLKNRIAAALAMSALQFPSLGIGPLTAYAVELFPTSLRGSAVGAVLMFGRIGSLVGANLSGVMLISACSATFYLFTVLLIVCGCVSFLLPREQNTEEPSEAVR